MREQRIRPFLKWPGGKYRLLPELLKRFVARDYFIEPFVGAGSVFLNTNYKNYWLADINQDLIDTFNVVKNNTDAFVVAAKKLFVKQNNNKVNYYKVRDLFNNSRVRRSDVVQRSAWFLYLNRHGYNGLCRYNLRGGYNVPFGRYDAPYFPREEIYIFAKKSQRAKFYCVDFNKLAEKLIKRPKSAMIYCDPPYVALSKTSSFSSYANVKFAEKQQQQLAAVAERLASCGMPVLLSNHDVPLTRQLYHNAQLSVVADRRMISCKPQDRRSVKELLAYFAV